jgi:hypothetical protein
MKNSCPSDIFKRLSFTSYPHSLLQHACGQNKKAGSHSAMATGGQYLKANVPHKAIIKQLDISKATLKKTLAFARATTIPD